jgi:hypothetical protein
MTEHNTPIPDADLARVEGAPTDVDLLALVDDDTTGTTDAGQIEELLRDTVPATSGGRVDLLPASFQLPALVRFVPNVELFDALERAVAVAVAVDVVDAAGVQKADEALGAVRDAMKAIEAHFDEPKRLAYEEHKRITGKLAEWLKVGDQAVDLVAGRILAETDRIEQAAREQARREQEALDAEARAQARQEADFAAAAGAPSDVVQALAQAAETATAQTVATIEPAAVDLSRNTKSATWKARLVGTAPGAEINPDSDELTPAQVVGFEQLLAAVLDGRASRACLSVNWSYVNKRAGADKTALQIPGLEAVKVAGLKGRRGR